MSAPGVIVIGLLLIGLIALLGWYLLVKTEGVYLGSRVVVWLYDVYAARYDDIKKYDATYETFFLARPILSRLETVPEPLLLDVGTGTGRVLGTLLAQYDFHGLAIGLDLSRDMLFQAAVNLAHCERGCDLVWDSVAALPFDDDTFDMVTCIEATEFFPQPRENLRELARVLRPGGWLLITNRRGRDARLMPGRVLALADLMRFLESDLGLTALQDERWQVDYDLVWAQKPGWVRPLGHRTVADLLRCPACGAVGLTPLDSGQWVCTACEARIPVGADGVIEVFAVRGGGERSTRA